MRPLQLASSWFWPRHRGEALQTSVAPRPAAAAAPLSSRVAHALGLSSTASTPTASEPGVRTRFDARELEALRSGPEGVLYRLGDGALDEHRLVARRIRADGREFVELSFRLAPSIRASFERRVLRQGAVRAPIEFAKAEAHGADVVRGHGALRVVNAVSTENPPDAGAGAEHALRLEGDDFLLDYVPSTGPLALRGRVRLELARKPARVVAQLGRQLGLDAVFAPATERALDRSALLSLLRHFSPAEADALTARGGDVKPEQVQETLLRLGADEALVEAVHHERVSSAHFAPVCCELGRRMREAGAKGAYTTIGSFDGLVGIIEHGLMAAVDRYEQGLLHTGASPLDDLASGGAVGSFLRVITPSGIGCSWPGRRFKILVSPAVFDRVDAWGWDTDHYGRSWGLGPDNFGPRLVARIEARGDGGRQNEFVVPHGVGPELILGVAVETDEAREELLRELNARGVTLKGGGSLEDFVRVQKTIV